MKTFEIEPSLVAKYTNGFLYNQYPHKSKWSEEFGDEEYKVALRKLFKEEKSPSLLYIHIPFCHRLCYFCLCHTVITKKYDVYQNYLEYLFREIDLLKEFFDKENITPNFREIHFGGGSPTVLFEPEFDRVIAKLQTLLNFKDMYEVTLEIDPRNIAGNPDRILYYHSKGITRISMGIQDFDPQVQKAINRIQPPEMIEELLTPEVREKFPSINFDIIVGLPFQTRDSFRKTIERVIEIGPDRIDMAFFNYAPRNAPQMKLIKDNRPDDYERHQLFLDGCNALVDAGYERIGFDHFAKPEDKQAKAVKEKTLRWNSLGYSPIPCKDMVGIGVNSGMDLTPEYYAQNYYEQENYEKAINEKKFPIFRGMKVSKDDMLRRDIINDLRNYCEVDGSVYEAKYGIDFNEYFKPEQTVIAEFVDDGILKVDGKRITMTEVGRHFCNMTCAIFDLYSRNEGYPHNFFARNQSDGFGVLALSKQGGR